MNENRGSFVIQRVNQDRSNGTLFVAQQGYKHSYTHSLHLARRYTSPEKANKDCCVENESVVDLRDLLGL